MNTEPISCGLRKNVLFVLKSSAFDGDRNYQAARMALSLAMDALPRVLFQEKALVLAVNRASIGKPLTDFYEQERFLLELGIPCYVVRDELEAQGIAESEVREGFQTIPASERDELLKRADFVITV